MAAAERAAGESDCGAWRRTTCPTASRFGQSRRATVSDTTTTPASAVRSACVKPRPLTTSMSSTSKYSGDTAIWSTGSSTSAGLPPSLGGDGRFCDCTRRLRRRGHGRHRRMGRHRLEQRGAPWLVGDGDHHRVARPHAGIHGRGGKGTSQKYGGADQEEGRCADLDGDQGMSRAARTRVPRHFAAHRPHQFEAGGLQRRHEPEEHRRDNGASHQEHQHPPVRGGGHDGRGPPRASSGGIVVVTA